MSNAIVRAALETRLKRVVESLMPPPVSPIAYQNAAFEKPASQPWLECFLIPSATIVRGVGGGSKTYLGIFQVNIWTPMGTGMGVAEAKADILMTWFSPDMREPKYPKLSITGASVGGALDDPSGWVATPVLINYRYDS